MKSKTKQDIEAVLKQCKKQPYLYPLAPLSMLGFILGNYVFKISKKDSVYGRLLKR
jgi:hypothetical protein